MTNYAILRTAKLKTMGNIGASLSHTYRQSGMAPNANPRLLANNKTLVGDPANGIEDIRNRINEITDQPRKNGVLCVEHLLAASPEFLLVRNKKISMHGRKKY